MATTYEMPTFADPAQVNVDSHEVCRIISFTPATWTTNDVFKIAKLPLNAKIANGWYVESTDIDTHATPTATVSLLVIDGNTTKTVISASTIPQAGGVVYDHSATYGQQTGVINYKVVGVSAYVALKAATGSATFATGTVKAQIRYTTNLEYND